MTDHIIAIGDVHGCAKALATLIEAIQPTGSDTLVFLGDYIGKSRTAEKSSGSANRNDNGPGGTPGPYRLPHRISQEITQRRHPELPKNYLT
jgi:hypothetical protein